MIPFEKLDLSRKAEYERILQHSGQRGCEYSFVNLYLWGRQKAAFLDGCLVLFSHFRGKSLYPFPVGSGDLGAVIDAVIHDARMRGIPCRFSGLTQSDRELLERLYPGRFHFHFNRDAYDYLYAIDDLADMKGRKFQKKRNHVNRFRENNPDWSVQPLTAENMEAAKQMVCQWFQGREDQRDYRLEKIALERAFSHYAELELEGLMLTAGGRVLGVTIGSRLNGDTFDIHFEKAQEDVDGAYPAIARAFAEYLREKYPQIRYLNREDDMGIEGLRKSKLSYHPVLLIEKSAALLQEEEDAV